MYPNNYGQYPYGAYNQNPYMQQVQQQRQAVQQFQDSPYSEVAFGTLDEAKAYRVMSTKPVLIINRDLNEAYEKGIDLTGKSYLLRFKYSAIEENTSQTKTTEIDPNMFVKRNEFDAFVNENKKVEVLTKEDLKDFITKGDLDALYNKLDILQRKINIKEIEKGADKDAKQHS